ncbi:MAG TPA: glycosyltransferase family A protein [Polyangiaceae bacterium]|nr:glycosyltransferase family A protein [Polyangiaceae bacterium]
MSAGPGVENDPRVDVSVVIPTCNRRSQVLSLLGDLARSTHPIRELLIVDSSDEPLGASDYTGFKDCDVQYVVSKKKSVCVQRNIGIRRARSSWIFLCDDDMQLPPDYLTKLVQHLRGHPEAGAVSGLWLEKSATGWQSSFPVKSALGLLWRYVFQLGIWGEIQVSEPLVGFAIDHYRRKGNHISRAGWPVIVDFSGKYFRTPIYSLGASLVRRDWLLNSPYDERLDPHGHGDNYGVALGFPEAIHVVTDVAVCHHKSEANRLEDFEAYARRLLALHYMVASRRAGALADARERFFIWSLIGQLVFHASVGNRRFAKAVLDTLLAIARGTNPNFSRAEPAEESGRTEQSP